MQYDVCFESRVWARALGLAEDQTGLRTVQRNWKALEELGLVEVEHSGRLLRVTLLHEDGSGDPYAHPGDVRDSRYIKLPYAYWLEGHADRLKLPGKALLLVACTLPDWFSLPFNKGPHWYGLGASTVERGLRELRRVNILEAHLAWRKAPLLRQGWTQDMRYRLLPPFGPSGKIAKGAPPELLLALKDADPSPQAEGADSKPKRRKPAAGKAKSSVPKVKRASPSSQADSSNQKPKRRKPAATRRNGTAEGGAGRKPSPTSGSAN
jgi:hypothetical protein